jgi:hypothetical protein
VEFVWAVAAVVVAAAELVALLPLFFHFNYAAEASCGCSDLISALASALAAAA